eukprot:GDKJ01041259.1.p1 GENE.GDKJ01041259.1~~GDKJ01041259.1.p1  ORF type:complete len:1962 (-),score=460.30 GDKJ01041259.1:397-5697(-)
MTILKLHLNGLIYSGFLRLGADICLMISPQILEYLIEWISEGPFGASKLVPSFMQNTYERLSSDWGLDKAYIMVGSLFAIGLFMSTMTVSLMQAQHNHAIYRVGVQCQSEMISAVYAKALKVSLPFATVGDGGDGEEDNDETESKANPGAANAKVTPEGYSPVTIPDAETGNEKSNSANVETHGDDGAGGDDTAGSDHSSAPASGVSVGQVVNLLSSDVERIYDFFTYIHVSWSSPLQITLATLLLVRVLGYCALPGIAVMALAVPLTSVVAGALEEIQKGVVRAKDRRTRSTHEFLSGVRVVKLYGWEDSFAAKVRQMRSEELGHLWGYYKAEVLTWLIYLLLPVMVCVVSFVSLFFLQPERLTPSVVFTSIALFALLKEPMQQLPYLIWTFVEGRNAARRLALFLSSPEVEHLRIEDELRAKRNFPGDFNDDDSDHGYDDPFSGNKKKGSKDDSMLSTPQQSEDETKREPKSAPPIMSMPLIEVKNLAVTWGAPQDVDLAWVAKEGDVPKLPGIMNLNLLNKLKNHDSRSAITEGDEEDDGGDDGIVTAGPTAPNTVFRGETIISTRDRAEEDFNLTLDNGIHQQQEQVEDEYGPNEPSGAPLLTDLNFSVHAGELLVVLGKTGEGKSSVVSALLGEMRVVRGSCKVKGSVAYAAQQAWIQQTSLRNNVLFGRPLDNAAYLTVVEACALVQDFEDCPGGDVWVVADKGAGLSGGQKQRVALARAAYSDADVYLLDDVLSAVDAHVAKHIFERLIMKYLRGRGKAVVLVTNNLSLAAHADKIIYLDSQNTATDGLPQYFTSFKDFKSSGVDLAALIKADEEAVEEAAAEEEQIEEQDERMLELDDYADEIQESDLQPRRKGLMADPGLFRSATVGIQATASIVGGVGNVGASGYHSGSDVHGEPKYRKQASVVSASGVRRRNSKERNSKSNINNVNASFGGSSIISSQIVGGSGSLPGYGRPHSAGGSVSQSNNIILSGGSLPGGVFKTGAQTFFAQKHNGPGYDKKHIKANRRGSDDFFSKHRRPASGGAIVMPQGESLLASPAHGPSSILSNPLLLSNASIGHSRKLDAVSKEAKKKIREARKKRREAAAAAVQKNAEDAQGALADRGSMDAFKFYFQRGWKPAFAFGVVCILLTHICNALGNYTLARASDVSKDNAIPMSTGLILYVSFCFIEGLSTYGSLMLAYLGGWFASKQIHDDLLTSITESSMRFFDTHPLGRVLNRFTKDTHALDKEVIQALWAWTFELFKCTVTISVIVITTPLVLVGIVPLGILYGLTQRLYIPASRALRRLSAGLRSPLLADCSEMLEGAFTVRAFKMGDLFMSQFEQKADRALSAHWCSCTANRWLTVRLEFVGNCTVFMVAMLCILDRDLLGPGLSGLVLTYALTVTESLAWLVRYGAECEAAMVAVDRLAEYTRTEEYKERLQPSPDSPNVAIDWPHGGELSFTELKMRYGGNEGPYALNGFTLDIRAGEKVGVVGRTGAGKSSLLLSLLRIVEPCEGRVILDGIDLSKMGVRDLRRRVAIIPQEPVLFTGNLRNNIDPLGEYTDAEVCLSIERAHLPAALSCDLEPLYMLDFPIEENGSNLSSGQRQLVCMARALCRSLDFSMIPPEQRGVIPISESTGKPAIRGSRVLLLDEATASLDPLTDQLMQETIAKEFADCTVIAIAHRLSSLMDYDRVVVMQKGQVGETGNPRLLADDPTTTFSQMVAAERRLAAGEVDDDDKQAQNTENGGVRRMASAQGVQDLLRRAEWFAVTSTSMDSN